MQRIMQLYFDWLCKLISNGRRVSTYRDALSYLFDRDFTYTIDRDGNRYVDGIDLRYRYITENDISHSRITDEFNNKPCSVLEMMVALAVRCEDHIMYDAAKGNRQGDWFWDMFFNLGLKPMTNANYDDDYICETVNRLLDRTYEPNGQGGLFTTNRTDIDMRDVEIWYQMMYYDAWE